MNRIIYTLILVGLCLSNASVRADIGAPYVPVRYTGQAEHLSGNATIAFALLDTANSTITQISGASSQSGWFTAVTSSSPYDEAVVAWLEPNKHYRFRIYANNIQEWELNFQAPDGYEIEYEGQLRSSKSWGNISWSPFQTEVTFRVVSIANRAAKHPGADSDLGDGRLYWEASLGSMPDGSSAGSLKIVDNQQRGFNESRAFSAAGLEFFATHMTYNWQFIPDGVTVVSNPAGVSSPEVPLAIRQVYAPQVVVDVVTSNTEKYELRYYRRDQATDTNAPNVPRFTFAGEPYLIYTIEREGPSSPVLQGLRLTRATYADGGTTPLSETVSTVTYAHNGTWTTTGRHTSSQTPLTVAETTISTVNSVTTQIMEVKPSAGSSTVDFTQSRTLEDESWGDIPTTSQLGSATVDPVKTTYHYPTGGYSSDPANWGLVNGRQFSENQWERIKRDAKTGRVKTRFRPWGNGPIFMNGDANLGDVDIINYSNNAFGESMRPSTGEHKVEGNAASSWEVTYTDSTVNSKAVVTASRIDRIFDVKELHSESSYYREDTNDYFFRMKMHSQVRPNGTKSSYVYQRGTLSGTTFTPSTSGWASRTVIIEGSDASPGMSGTQLTSYGSYDIDDIYVVTGRSTKRIILRDSMSRVVREENYVYGASSWALLDAENLVYDYAQRLESRTTASNGLSIDYTYTSRGEVASVTDAEGQSTSYTYDDAGRVATVIKSGRAVAAGVNAVDDLRTAYTYNSAGLVTEIRTGPQSGETLVVTRAYDDAGRMTSQTHPDTGTVTTSYSLDNGSGAGASVTKTYADGATETLLYFKDGKPKELTGTGVVPQYYTYTIDATAKRLVTTTHMGSASSARWSKTHHDWFGRLTKTEQPGYASGGLSNPNFTTTHTYADQTGFKTQTTATGYAITLYTYDGLGALKESGLDIDGTGTLTANSSDRIKGREFGFENLSVNSSPTRWWWRNRPYHYGADGNINNTTKVYLGDTYQAASALGTGVASLTYSYNTNGWFSSQTVAVDDANKLTTVTGYADAVGSTISKSYAGLPLHSTEADGRIFTSSYDALRRPSSRVDPRTGSTTFAYHTGKTLLSSVTAPGSRTTSFGYDSRGRTNHTTDPLARATRQDYTLRGQLEHTWGSGTYPVSYTYDTTYGNRTAMTTYRSGTGWDGATWPTGNTSDSTTTWVHDAPTGQLYQKKDAANATVSYLYNSSNQLSKRTWARGVTTDYTYSALGTGELTHVDYSDSTPDITHSYDRRGLSDTISDYTGTRSFAYCECGKLTSETHGTVLHNNWALTYQLDNTSGGAKGRTTSYTLKEGATTRHSLSYGYDTAGRLNGITTGGLIGAYDFDYTYLANSALVSALDVAAPTAAQPFQFARTWETDRDLVDVASTSWNTTTVASYNYAYNAGSERTSVIQGGTAFSDYGTADTFTHRRFTYNTRGELTTDIGHGNGTPSGGTADLPGRRFEFSYDDIGNRLSSNRTGVAGLQDDYVPNKLNQYTTRENNTLAVSGTVANSSVKVAVKSTGGTYQTAGREAGFWSHEVTPANTNGPVKETVDVIAADAGAGSGGADLVSTDTTTTTVAEDLQTYFYDADGNVTNDGLWVYTWDAENRLIAMETTTTAANLGVDKERLEFYYDYMNRRVRKLAQTWNTVTPGWDVVSDRRFIYEGWNVIHEEDTVSLQERTFAWGLDLVNSLSASGGVGALMGIYDSLGSDPGTSGAMTYLAGYDGNGNLTTLLDATDGSIEAAYEYGPYGEALRSEGAYAKNNPFRFSTKYTDDETGLVYYGRRYYDPKDGRFVCRDPLEESGGINLMAFVANNAPNRWDYLGMYWDTEWNSGSDYFDDMIQAQDDMEWANDCEYDGDCDGRPSSSFFLTGPSRHTMAYEFDIRGENKPSTVQLDLDTGALTDSSRNLVTGIYGNGDLKTVRGTGVADASWGEITSLGTVENEPVPTAEFPTQLSRPERFSFADQGTLDRLSSAVQPTSGNPFNDIASGFGGSLGRALNTGAVVTPLFAGSSLLLLGGAQSIMGVNAAVDVLLPTSITYTPSALTTTFTQAATVNAQAAAAAARAAALAAASPGAQNVIQRIPDVLQGLGSGSAPTNINQVGGFLIDQIDDQLYDTDFDPGG